jgi:hypothetical protein
MSDWIKGRLHVILSNYGKSVHITMNITFSNKGCKKPSRIQKVYSVWDLSSVDYLPTYLSYLALSPTPSLSLFLYRPQFVRTRINRRPLSLSPFPFDNCSLNNFAAFTFAVLPPACLPALLLPLSPKKNAVL